MEKNNKIKIGLLALAILFSTLINAQFQITPATFGEFMGTAPIIRGVGIGNFPSGVTTNSALHVNTNFMTASTNYPGINFGEVFRTDGPAGVTHAWRMLSNNGTAGEKFNILNPSGTDNINMGTVPLGDFNFFTNNTQRMTIIGRSGSQPRLCRY
ncbi:MAG: hypothetical protein IPO27_09695 [Bacteroidetes bacterium]|nr:hypothetical protein [Bacteroidota bacterium]